MSSSSLAVEMGEFTHLDRARSFYKPELDILRFGAFLGVFVFHTITYSCTFLVQHQVPFWLATAGLSVIYAGKYGVDLFFVLSAYLITELLICEKESVGRLNVGAFYLRRILRIWPLYYLFIGLVLFVPFMDRDHAFSLRYVVPFLFLMGNWSYVLFGVKGFVAVPLWSVSVEEQFYLLWPPVVARLSRRQIIATSLLMICLANAVRVVALSMHQNTMQLWMNSFAHFDSISSGILVATLRHTHKKALSINYGLRIVLTIAAMGSLGVVAHFAEQQGNVFFPTATLIGGCMVPLACTAILISFVDLPFRSVVLQYLGKISYGLYVFHLTALLLVDRFFQGKGYGAAHAVTRILLILAVTIAMSAISYKVVETPFLNLKKRFTYVRSRPA
jgi:peptidoglycan/LPS O-acetylase OafA/YrhL